MTLPKSTYLFWSSLLVMFCVLTSGSAKASDRPDELLIGIEPEHNIFEQVEGYRKLADYLSEKCGFKVRVTIMSRYGEALQRFKNRKLDGAFLSSYTAAMAIRELQLEPAARLVNLQGSSVAHGYLFTRRDSGIKKIEDTRGKTFAFVDPATAEGYLFPLALLNEKGIKDAASFLRQYHFTGSHASTVFAVLDGRADLGASKDTIYNKQTSQDPTISRELFIIAKSQPVPETTLCLKQDLPPVLKAKLTSILLGMADNEQGRKILNIIEASRFTGADETDYDIILQMEKKAGVSGTGADIK